MNTFKEEYFLNNDILIVDDNSGNRKLLSDILESNNYKVRCSENGVLALKSIKERIPMLVILDVEMPEMGGFEVCRYLKEDSNTNSIPIIFISGFKDEDNKLNAFQAGGVDYICKPFYPDEVLARVNVHLSLHCAQLELKQRNDELNTAQNLLSEEIKNRTWESDYNSISSEISSRILSQYSIEEISNIFLKYALDITKSEFGFVGIIDQKTGYLLCPAYTEGIWKKPDIEDNKVLFKTFDGLWGWVLNNKKSLIINSLHSDYRFKSIQEDNKHIKKYLASPAIVNYHLYGLIAVANSEEDYDDKQLKFINMLAEKYAVAIVKIQMGEKLLKFTYALEQSPVSIIITDERGNIEYVNPKFLKVTGYSYQEVLGNNPRMLKSGEKSNEDYKKLWDTISAGKEWRGEFHNKKKNGELFWESASISPLIYEGDKILHYIAIKEDITERKFVEQQLRMFAHTIKCISECISITDIENKLFFVNEAFIKTYGYEENELLGSGIEIIDSPNNDPEIIKEKKSATISGGWQGELLNRRKDGSEFPIFLSTSLVHDDDGKIVGLVGVARDITPQKKAEEALARERNLLRRLIDNIPDRIYAKDKKGRFIICNQALAGRMGFNDPKDVIGKTDFDLLPSELAMRFYSDEKSVIETGQSIINREEPMNTASGEIRWNLATKVPLYDKNGRVVGIVGMGREITERKKAEESIRKSEIRFRSVWNNSFNGMRLADEEGKIIVVNEAFCKMMEKSEGELQGKSLEVLYRLEDQSKILKTYIKRFQTGVFQKTVEKEMIIWNAKSKWFEVSNSMIESENDKPLLLSIFRDITERKEFEKAFLESQEKLLLNEKKYRQLIETTHEGVVQIDLSGIIIFSNQRLSEMLKYDNNELTGSSVFSLLDQKNSVILSEKLENRRKGISEQYELEMIKKDGGRIIFSVSGSPVTDSDGKPAGSFGIYIDITEKKIIEELLIYERHLFNSLMDNTPDFIYFKDVEGKFIRVNKSLAKFFGLKNPSEAMGKSDQDFFSKEATEIFEREEKKLLKTGEPIINIDSMNKSKDGRLGWTSATKILYRNSIGEIAGILGINRDITDRKIMEQILWNEKEELKVTLASVGEGVVTTNQDGSIILFNKKAEEITGWMFEDTINKPFSEIIVLMNNKKEQVYFSPIKKLLGSIPDNNLTDEAILITKSNREHIINYSVSSIMDKDSRRTGFVIVFRDITEQRSMESQALLSQKMESIGQLAAGISHEINTPMQYIGDNTRFLQDSFKDISDIIDCVMILIDSKNDKESFEVGVAQLNELIKQIDLDYLRTEIPNAIDQSITGIDRVRNIVLAMKDFAHPGIKSKSFLNLNHGIEVTATISRNEWKYVADLETNLEKDLPPVFCNLDEINQVILNMIVNSAHSIKDIVEKETGKKGRIVISTRSEGDFAIIKISDTGKGIPKEIINRIFDPFFTTKEIGKGTGQGLAIAHNIIVKKHKGIIQVESEPGKGTVFTLTLPIKDETDNKKINGK